MKRIHFNYSVIILIAATLTGGCGSVYYVPGRITTPHFDSTYDTYLAAGYGAGGSQLDLAVATTKHFWMEGHVAYIPFDDTLKQITTGAVVNYSNGKSLGELKGEFGLGWFSGSEAQIGALAGLGFGESSFIRLKDSAPQHVFPIPREVGHGYFTTYFVQASGAPINTGSNAYFQLLLRAEYIDFDQFTIDELDRPLPSALLIQPRIVYGAPIPQFPGLQCEIQMGIQFRAGGRERFDYYPLHFSCAIMGLMDFL